LPRNLATINHAEASKVRVPIGQTELIVNPVNPVPIDQFVNHEHQDQIEKRFHPHLRFQSDRLQSVSNQSEFIALLFLSLCQSSSEVLQNERSLAVLPRCEKQSNHKMRNSKKTASQKLKPMV
jgi:predicted GIY-YIG superfamily endonuclease